MKQEITLIHLVVRDYEEAIKYFTEKLEFKLVENSMDGEKRWIIVAPPGSKGTQIHLAKASTKEQQRHIGNQTGGRVFLSLQTDNFWKDYKKMKARGVNFIEEPREESYGIVVKFEDLYGNKWDLMESRKPRERILVEMLTLIGKNPGIRPAQLNKLLNMPHTWSLRKELLKRGLIKKEKKGSAVYYYPKKS